MTLPAVRSQGFTSLQLLSAWTWSEEFDLQDKFEDLSSEIRPFRYAGEEVDATLLLRCCAAVIARDAAPEMLVNLDGALVRRGFEEVSNGVKGAIDFLREQLSVYSIVNLPFPTLLVPLAVFFAVPDGAQLRMTMDQSRALKRWFWRSCFSRRFASGVLRYLKTDIEEAAKLRNRQTSELGTFKAPIGPEFFLDTAFRHGSVNSKTFVLVAGHDEG